MPQRWGGDSFPYPIEYHVEKPKLCESVLIDSLSMEGGVGINIISYGIRYKKDALLCGEVFSLMLSLLKKF